MGIKIADLVVLLLGVFIHSSVADHTLQPCKGEGKGVCVFRLNLSDVCPSKAIVFHAIERQG